MAMLMLVFAFGCLCAWAIIKGLSEL